jgi:NET1-associated nuclear protein 1 (U3 small nucleolar RNA-associated protein 17)
MASSLPPSSPPAAQLLTPGRLGAGALAASARAAALKYSASGRFLFQRQGHVLRVLHARNGQLLHECVRADAGERSDATAMALHPHNALQLLVAYADGKILVWDFVEEKVLQELDARAPVLWMESSVATPSMLMLVVSNAGADKPQAEADKDGEKPQQQAIEETELLSNWALVEFNMKKKRRGRTLLQHKKLPFHTAAMQSYRGVQGDDAETFQGDYVVVAAAAKVFAVRVRREAESSAAVSRAFTLQKLTHLRDVTCVAVNPRMPEFALGDQLGQMFRYLDDASGVVASTAKMHWHSHAVQSLTYSSDGKFLFSGGEECVLVSWNLESGRRAYLPRRSSAITTIATTNPNVTDEAESTATGGIYAVALGDNVLFQYNAITREEEWHALGLARSGAGANRTLPSRHMDFDPVSMALPLNGVSTAGVLQFYDAYKDRVLQSVVLTERNQVTRTENEEIPRVIAEHVRFSSNGHDMVTLHTNVYDDDEEEEEDKEKEEQALRFWKRRADGSFVVNTAIDAPHGSAHVTCVAYSPSPFEECVATCDVRGEFKIWKQVREVRDATTHSSNPTTIMWHCQSVVKFRDARITAVAFASDGSLLAVAYGHLLTLWDVSTNALKQVISSADGQVIRDVTFTGRASPFVVLTTSTQVQVWNLLRLELWWRYDVPENAAFVSADAQRERFMVWLRMSGSPVDDKETSLTRHVALVFAPESPAPVAVAPLDVGKAAVWSAALHPKNGDVVVLDSASNVWRVAGVLGDDTVAEEEDEAEADEPEETNALAALYKASTSSAQRHNKAARKSNAARKANGGESASSALFEAPAHVLPSMTALYRSFMDTMLPKSHQTIDGDGDDANASVGQQADKRTKKKQQKKRKKQQQQQQQQADSADTIGDDADGQRREKRAKQLVEKELANQALQQQTYSKLLEAFRKNRQGVKSQ